MTPSEWGALALGLMLAVTVACVGFLVVAEFLYERRIRKAIRERLR